MKKPQAKGLTVVKRMSMGVMPTYINLLHRHLQKEKPLHAANRTFSTPVDLLRLNFPAELVDEIVEINLTYHGK